MIGWEVGGGSGVGVGWDVVSGAAAALPPRSLIFYFLYSIFSGN